MPGTFKEQNQFPDEIRLGNCSRGISSTVTQDSRLAQSHQPKEKKSETRSLGSLAYVLLILSFI